MGKTTHKKIHAAADDAQREDNAVVFADRGKALETAREEASRWSGLLERLAK